MILHIAMLFTFSITHQTIPLISQSGQAQRSVVGKNKFFTGTHRERNRIVALINSSGLD